MSISHLARSGWSLMWNQQDENGPSTPVTFLGAERLLDVPLEPGNWIDVKMEITWSTDDDDGMVRVWINVVRQTLLTGGQTFTGRTAVPNSTIQRGHLPGEGRVRSDVDSASAELPDGRQRSLAVTTRRAQVTNTHPTGGQPHPVTPPLGLSAAL